MSDLMGKPRALRLEELDLVRGLIALHNDDAQLAHQIEGGLVHDFRDGGMGGLRFAGPEGRSLGRKVAEAEYVDVDGVTVSIVLNADQNGQLFELDIWKVDFSPLKKYPSPTALRTH